MSSRSQNSHNPLRPYYIPPLEAPYESIPTNSSTSSIPASISSVAAAAPTSYSILSDFQQDYSDYLETPSVGESVQNLLNTAILKYTSVLIGQPFEVAKTILQCQFVPKQEIKPKKATWPEETGVEDDLSDDSDDEPTYFTSNVSPDESPSLRPTKALNGRNRKTTDRAGYVLEDKEDKDIARPLYQIRQIRDGAIGDTMKALWAKEGGWGIWKGQNATFIYTVCASTMEAWTSSFISAILALPDPGITEMADATHPMATLGIAVASSVLTALALAPLDIIRTKLILTPSSSKPRNLLPALKALPSYTIPQELILPTTLYALIPSVITLGSPYLIKTKLHLDPVINSTSFGFFSFIAGVVELFFKLPLETVLRRAQISVAKPEQTIVPVGRYAGVVGTAWVLVKEEESGKWGIGGLYRGWRVGAWGSVGVLGLGIVGVQQSQTGEF